MNLDLDAFTYITGIAGLLGLVLQLKDVFPEHREIRKTIVLIVIGVFVGSFIATVRGVKVDVGTTITPSRVLIAVFVAVLAFIAIVATFTKDDRRRTELFAFTGLGTAALFLLLFVTGLGSIEDSRVERDRRQITLEELITLTDIAVSKGSFDRELLLIGEAKHRLSPRDERRKLLEKRDEDIKVRQIGGAKSVVSQRFQRRTS